RLRIQFLDGDDVGLDPVEYRADLGRHRVLGVEVGGEEPKHERVMVCDHGDMSFAGRLLVATPLITDPHFFHTVVHIYAHDEEDGAAGVIVNRPTEEPTIEHLPEWRSSLFAPPVVFWGGPVTPDSGVVVI